MHNMSNQLNFINDPFQVQFNIDPTPPCALKCRGPCTQLRTLLGLCALSCRASTYAMTQNLDFHFRAISHTCSILITCFHYAPNYLELSSIYTIHGPRTMGRSFTADIRFPK